MKGAVPSEDARCQSLGWLSPIETVLHTGELGFPGELQLSCQTV